MDGHYLVTGMRGQYLTVMKLSPQGDILWATLIECSGDNMPYNAFEMEDGGYFFMARITFHFATISIGLFKFDQTGTLLWAKEVGGAGEEKGHSIIGTSDGGFFITGKTESEGAGYADILTLKVDKNGDVEWMKMVGLGNYEEAL